MNHRLLGFFSGFPTRRFPYVVAKHLGEKLTNHNNLVFVSAWPADYAMEDDSAIFVTGDRISYTGKIYFVSKGKLSPFTKKSHG